MTPMAYGAADGPGRVGDKTSIRARTGRQLSQFDGFDLGPGASLAGQLQTAASLQIDLCQQVTFYALLEYIVDFALIAKIEGPVNIVPQATNDLLPAFV